MLATLVVCAFAGTVLMYPAFHSDLADFVHTRASHDVDMQRLRNLVGDISVIIPARNEELTLPILLRDLGKQSLAPRELIVVDDESEDGTATIASRSAKLVRAGKRPDGWLGKPWALHTGAMVAEGEFLLFLDADVQLHRNALETLGRALLAVSPEPSRSVISVQPYHRTIKFWERLAMLFNILVFVGAGRPEKGLRFTMKGDSCFGPCILCGRKEYRSFGGHEAVRAAILDDMDLGREFAKAGAEVRGFSGRGVIDFRMYPSGFRTLVDGFTKNLLLGARRSRRLFRALALLWFTGLIAVLPYIAVTASLGMVPEFVVATVFYTFFVIQIAAAGARLGNFGALSALFFPIHLALFLLVLFRAVVLALRGRNVQWKGRRLNPEL